jgi:hypothetical protein
MVKVAIIPSKTLSSACLVLKKVDTFLMLTLTQIYILFLILNLLYEFKFALPMKAEESNAEEQLSRK